MARDHDLEERIRGELRMEPGISEKAMFGGLAWLLNGNMLCCAGKSGLLARLGKGRDAWALEIDGVVPMEMNGRPMKGWVWAGPGAHDLPDVRRRLIAAAIEYVRTLPAK